MSRHGMITVSEKFVEVDLSVRRFPSHHEKILHRLDHWRRPGEIEFMIFDGKLHGLFYMLVDKTARAAPTGGVKLGGQNWRIGQSRHFVVREQRRNAKIGARAFCVSLHAPWPDRAQRSRLAYPAAGALDALIAALPAEKKSGGWNTAGNPLGRFP